MVAGAFKMACASLAKPISRCIGHRELSTSKGQELIVVLRRGDGGARAHEPLNKAKMDRVNVENRGCMHVNHQISNLSPEAAFLAKLEGWTLHSSYSQLRHLLLQTLAMMPSSRQRR